MPLRKEVWGRLGGDLKPAGLDAIATTTSASTTCPPPPQQLMERKALGRIVVDCGGGTA